MVREVTPTEAVPPLVSGEEAGASQTKRIGTALLIGSLATSLPTTAAAVVLLPHRIAEVSPDNKVALLAVLTVAGSLVGLVSNIVCGGLSDRTRSRFGARTPWIIGGSVTTLIAMIPVAIFANFVVTTLSWCLVAIAINAPMAALAAVLPDRVPVAKRATVSAMVGLGLLIGGAGGSVVGAVFVTRVGLGLMVAVSIAAVLMVSAAALINEPDNRHETPAQNADANILRASFTLPRNAADFYWALFGRLALVLGYFMVNGYQLYILTDYVGLSDERAAAVVGINAIIFVVTSIVGVLAAGPASDRLQVRKPFVIAASAVAICAVLPPLLSDSVTAMHLFAVVGGLAFGSYFSVDAALVSEVLPDEETRARDLGIQNIANSGGQVLAPGASAGLVALGLGFGPVFFGAIAVMAVGALLVIPIKSVK